MDLTDYWGVGPKTKTLLTENLGTTEAANAIEQADIQRLVDAGLPRGRATRIAQRARAGEDIEVLATPDTREVYRQILDLIKQHAVSTAAMDRISVLTPTRDPDTAKNRLESNKEAHKSWRSLHESTREEILDAYTDLRGEEVTEKSTVETALALIEIQPDGATFKAVTDLSATKLRDALDALQHLRGGTVDPRADPELEQIHTALKEIEEMEDNSLDIAEEIRDESIQELSDLGDALLDYIATRADIPYEDITDATPAEAHDATDYITSTLRSLADTQRQKYEDKQLEIQGEIQSNLEETRDAVDKAKQAVNDIAYRLSIARFIEHHDLEPPSHTDKTAAIKQARNLALAATQPTQQPIDYAIGEHSLPDIPSEEHVAVLTGANSGGKTTLLETLCQHVLLTQMGLPVPSDQAEIGFYDHIVFHRRHASFNAGVLESTLRTIIPPLTSKGKTLMLVDEFEAITEPGSAAALLHGLVNLTVKQDARGVYVTHLAQELEPLPHEGRLDGIFAEGLDEDMELRVDYQPRFHSLGKSTPEFIVSRLIAHASNQNEKMGYNELAESIGIEKIQKTLDDV